MMYFAGAVRANPLTTKSSTAEIESRVKVWLRGAIDRDGGRSARASKKVRDTPESGSRVLPESPSSASAHSCSPFSL